MKNVKLYISTAAMVLISSSSFAQLSEDFKTVSEAGAWATSSIPLFPTYLSVATSRGGLYKVVVAAKDDAANFVAGGNKSALLEKAMGIVQAESQVQYTDEQLAEIILAF